MPLLPIRCQIFFTQSLANGRAYGWTETHYSITGQTLATALDHLRDLAIARSNLLGASVLIPYLRVSNDNVFRDSQVTGGILPTGSNLKGPYYNRAFALAAADFAYSVALFRITGDSDFYRRSLYISGNPDGVQEVDFIIPSGPLGPAWVNAFGIWRTVLMGGAWGFKVLLQGPGNPIAQIDDLTAGVFTSHAAHGFAQNEMVRVSRFTPTVGAAAANNPNGVWQVRVISGTTFALRGYTQVAFDPRRLGQVQARRYDVTPYKALVLRRWGSHKRGRPFDQSRGRVPNRA